MAGGVGDLPGNTADKEALRRNVVRLRQRFNVTSAIVVADRGMIAVDTIGRHIRSSADVYFTAPGEDRQVHRFVEHFVTHSSISSSGTPRPARRL